MTTTDLIIEATRARAKAHAKHGANSIEALAADSPRWLPVLIEEVGEVANTLTYDGPDLATRAELMDVLAVVTAWLDAIDTRDRLNSRRIQRGLAPVTTPTGRN
jgi:NTP pyrophosphatase (non-canonical NTP hydrolase)